MARRVILADDLTNVESEDVETITYMVQGVFYEIDLSEDSWKKMDSALARFIKNSREITRAAAITRFTQTSDSENEKIREWARSQGYEVGERGRISEEIRQGYQKHVESEMDSQGETPTGKVTESNGE
jgi:hypothetical protein